MKDKPELVFAANVQRYDCGCIIEWAFIGTFSDMYNVTPCYKHASMKEEMQNLAESDWDMLMDYHQ